MTQAVSPASTATAHLGFSHHNSLWVSCLQTFYSAVPATRKDFPLSAWPITAHFCPTFFKSYCPDQLGAGDSLPWAGVYCSLGQAASACTLQPNHYHFSQCTLGSCPQSLAHITSCNLHSAHFTDEDTG